MNVPATERFRLAGQSLKTARARVGAPIPAFLAHEILVGLAMVLPFPYRSRHWIDMNMAFGGHAHYLFQWDSLWFMHIASAGYRGDVPSAAFFPWVPIVIRLFGSWGALGLTQLALLGALLLLPPCLAVLGFGSQARNRAVWFFALNPALIYYSALYAEPWTMLAVLLLVYYCDRGRFGRAGAAGMVASLTQAPGVLAGAFPLVLFGHSLWTRHRKAAVGFGAVGLGCAAGVGGFGAFLAATFQRPLIVFQVQRTWGQDWIWPYHQWIQALGIIVRRQDLGLAGLWAAATTLMLAGVVGVVAMWNYRGKSPVRIAGILYLILGLALSTSFGTPSYPFHSTVRFLSDYFPVYGGLGVLTSRRWLFGVLLVLSATIGLMGSMLFTHSWAYQ
jgi:hypothetical protein